MFKTVSTDQNAEQMLSNMTTKKQMKSEYD